MQISSEELAELVKNLTARVDKLESFKDNLKPIEEKEHGTSLDEEEENAEMAEKAQFAETAENPLKEDDVAEVAVVSHGKSGRNEQEGVTLLREHLLGDVLASVVRRNGEVVYRRFVALLGLHRLGVYILPCRVGVVVERELARHAVLAQYERAFELRLFGSFLILANSSLS